MGTRQKAVNKINDEPTLIEVVKNDSDNWVPFPAIKKVTDEPTLNYVALNDSDSEIRMETVKMINDDSILVEVVKNDSNSDVRREAINRISDESILKELEGKVLFDEYVEELVRLYKSQPEGFYIDSRSVESVRYVGEKLSELGGFDIMLQAHKIFSNQINNGGLSGNLEMVGDGIGSWRG